MDSTVDLQVSRVVVVDSSTVEVADLEFDNCFGLGCDSVDNWRCCFDSAGPSSYGRTPVCLTLVLWISVKP